MLYYIAAFLVILSCLVLFLFACLLVLWRRLRRLEAQLARETEETEQGSLVLQALVEDLERAGQAVLDRIAEKEHELLGRMQADSGNVFAFGAGREAQEAPDVAPEARVSTDGVPDERAGERRETLTAAIRRLAEQGLTAEEVARRLQVGTGEVKLIMELQRLQKSK